MIELDVPFFKQDTEYTCGPTALQMVLAYYGKRLSEAELARLLDTDQEQGTYRVSMYELSVLLGFHCYVNDEARFPELEYLLKLGIPPIVRFLEPEANEDHYGVVIAADEHHIILHDPWNGPTQRYTKSEYEKRWTCDELGNCHHWLLGISRDPLALGKQFHPHG